jgi:16S rRNA (guanine527-N7)-methyltransferase
METARIAELLVPFLGDETLSEEQLTLISTYIDVLMKWNAHMNLTAVREPEQIVERHFGEALFAARHLVDPSRSITVADIGSGAGFPGIPIKIYARQIHLTLIEAHGKKATFLREVGRALSLINVDVFAGRAEQWGRTADLVTLRAVERFEAVLPAAVRLVSPGGSLGLLIGAKQAFQSEKLVTGKWGPPVTIPGSRERVLKVLKMG